MKVIFLTQIYLLWSLVRDSSCENSVRLINGKTPNEGFIQIRFNDTWGTLLDYGDMANEPLKVAFVVCRMLNYTKTIKGNSVIYGPHNGTYFPKILNCGGREENIQQCRQEVDIKLDGSPPQYIVSTYAVCGNLSKVDETLKVRLVSTIHKNMGFVEQSYKQSGLQVRTWSRICVGLYSGIQWHDKCAATVCTMLGFNRSVGAFLHNVGTDQHSSVTKSYYCTGKEKTIAACGQIDRDICSKGGYYVGAFCVENIAAPQPVIFRLSSDKAPNVGFLEVQQHGVWGTVCPTLAKKPGDFVCSQLGFLGMETEGWQLQPKGAQPQTFISWEFNDLCSASRKGNCSADEMWNLQYLGPCEYVTAVTCKVSDIPKYKLVSGCPPRLIINRTGMSNKEKQLITYYKINIKQYQSYKDENESVFFIPGNTTTLIIGDGKKYMNGVNKPVMNEKNYYVKLTAVYEDKNGNLGYGRINNRNDLPSVKKTGCPPTTQAPSEPTYGATNSSKGSKTDISTTSKPISTVRIVLVVTGVLIFVGSIVAIVVFVYRNCINNNRSGSNRHRGEHMRLTTVPEVEDERL